jgi:hypothetical protein
MHGITRSRQCAVTDGSFLCPNFEWLLISSRAVERRVQTSVRSDGNGVSLVFLWELVRMNLFCGKKRGKGRFTARVCYLIRELLTLASERKPLWQRHILSVLAVCFATLLILVYSAFSCVGGVFATQEIELKLAKLVVRARKRVLSTIEAPAVTTGESYSGRVSLIFLCSCQACSGSSFRRGTHSQQHLEESRVLQVRKLLGLQGLHAEAANKSQWCSDQTIRRYIESYGHRLDVAAKHLAATIKWRIQESVHELTVSEFRRELKAGLISFGGFDSFARPVFIVRFVPGFNLRLLILMLEVAENILASDAVTTPEQKDMPRASSASSWWQRVYRSIFGETKRTESDRESLHRNRWVWIVEWGRIEKRCRRQNCAQCLPPQDRNCYEEAIGGVSAAELVRAFRVCNEHYPNRLHAAYVLGAPRPVVSLFGIVAKQSTKRKVKFVRLREGCDGGTLGEYGAMWRRPWTHTEFSQLIDKLDGSLSISKTK